MPILINKLSVVSDCWTPYTSDALPAALSPEDHVLVSVSDWPALRSTLIASSAQIGVCAANTTEPEILENDLSRLNLIAIDFPIFTDGRGYSLARQWREAGFRGELRAIGDILPDQIFYLARCGFDTFALKDGQSPEIALAALHTFSTSYQAAADTPLPLYRRESHTATTAAPTNETS
ncbi:MAG: DUF934 domain-containing protein [Gammaproteobacteria bacterium]